MKLTERERFNLRIILAGLCIKLTSQLLWSAFNIRKVFYVGDALSFSVIIYAIWQLFPSEKKISKLFGVFFWLSINNLLDEMFFNPLTLGINELAIGIIILIYLCRTYARKQ